MSKFVNLSGYNTLAVQAIPIIVFAPGGLSNQLNGSCGVK